MEKTDDSPEDVKRATAVVREIKKGQKDDTFEGYPRIVEKKKRWEHCDKPPSKKPKLEKSNGDCCQTKRYRKQRSPKFAMVSVFGEPCIFPKVDIIPRHCLTKEDYIDMLATPSRKCPPDCRKKMVLRRLKPVSPRIKELAQPSRQRMLMTLQQGASILPPALLDNLVRTVEKETCLTPEQAATLTRKKKSRGKKRKGTADKWQSKEVQKSKKPTVGIASSGSFDKDAVSCQYLMAERFVRSILKWKCSLPKSEFTDVAEVIVKRLIDVLEYTPPQNEDRKSQQIHYLADVIACWITGVLSEVAQYQEEKLKERCRKKEEEMKADEEEEEDEDEEEDKDGDKDDDRKRITEAEDEEDEEDSVETEQEVDEKKEVDEMEVALDFEDDEEELEVEIGEEEEEKIKAEEPIDEIILEVDMETETQVEPEVQVETEIQTEPKEQIEVEVEAHPELETVGAEVDVGMEDEAEADVKETVTAAEEETETAAVEEEAATVEEDKDATAEVTATEAEIEKEAKEKTTAETEPEAELEAVVDIEAETEEPEAELEAAVDIEAEAEEPESVEVHEETVLKEDGDIKKKEEIRKPVEEEEVEAEVPEKINIYRTKIEIEKEVPKDIDIAKSLEELLKTDLPFLTFDKIIDTIYKMIENMPENTGEDSITNGIHRAIYEKLSNIVKLEDPDLLTDDLMTIMNVVCGKIANWLRSLLTDSQIAFMEQYMPEVESKEVRDWTRWLEHISDVAKDWNIWLRGVIEEIFGMENEQITRGEWQDWTKSVDTKALLWRRFHLQVLHEAHRNVTMIVGRRVVKTGTKRLVPDASERLINTTDLQASKT
ncbi:uncharacterized protein LOC143433508 [Xylocopa sonorina]|uniref:uncharacterized protein LOC143433508 n=1 Tax=Xylocopa sonorina TaxID=1818115 RepID=UPI00403B3787